MEQIGTFPFGKPVRMVKQEDCTPKRVFVLGVYSSAVHARWEDSNGNEIVKALAVDSEPYIFWRGDGAEAIIQRVIVPDKFGKLRAADQQFNGPSGSALDACFLKPLGLNRADGWLCDLVPHSCSNPSQQGAIYRAYKKCAEVYNLPTATVPPVPSRLPKERLDTILGEINQSQARVLILLGDLPIKWFLFHFDKRWQRLSDFGKESWSYGQLHAVEIGDRKMQVLPLAHPRQVAKLGKSSSIWYLLHQDWCDESAHGLIG